jgi:U3 small nucleolar RNA-associated protein 20
MLFFSVVMNLVNDESAKCREMAGLLISSISLRLDIRRMDKHLLFVEKWFAEENLKFGRIACQVKGLIVQVWRMYRNGLPRLYRQLNVALKMANGSKGGR